MTASRTGSRAMAAAMAMLFLLPVHQAAAADGDYAVPANQPGLFERLFSFGGLDAWDYILLFVALFAAMSVFLFYYRAVLLDALKKMQPPSRVKMRAAGLALATFALLLMLSPSLPAGILLIISLVGLVLAMASGLGTIAGIILLLVTALLFVAWITGLLNF